MTRQKSEDPIVPEGLRKLSPIARMGRGGKGVPVDQEMEQLGLPFATAENPQGAGESQPVDRSTQPTSKPVPKASVLDETSPSTAMEEVLLAQAAPAQLEWG